MSDYVMVKRSDFIQRNHDCTGFDACRWCRRTAWLADGPDMPMRIEHAMNCPLVAGTAPPSDDRFRKIVEDVRALPKSGNLAHVVHYVCDEIVRRLDAATQETKG